MNITAKGKDLWTGPEQVEVIDFLTDENRCNKNLLRLLHVLERDLFR